MTDFSLPSHLRVGWADYGRPCDAVVKAAFEALPGPTLPSRWAWKTHEHFINKYGNLGSFLWGKTASYHLLMLNGWHVIRVWTDSPKTCIVDVSDAVATSLSVMTTLVVEDIPDSVSRKCQPLTKRVRGVTLTEIHEILRVIRHVYGV